MGCGVSVFEPHEETTAAEGQPTTTTNNNNNNKHIDDADSSPPSAEGNNSSVMERKSDANSAVQLRGLRKIRADVHAITRYNNHNHYIVDVDERNNNSMTTSKNLLLPPPTKDGQPLVVAVKAVGGEKTTMEDDIKEEHGGEGHKENSILLSHGSPSFRVYCVEDLPPLDDDHDSLSHDDERDHKEDDSEKENKIPTNDGSNKGEEGNRRKKKGGKMRGRGMRSVLPRGGGSGGMRHIFNPHRLRNHSSNHLH